jgi:hypothetical protein
MGQFCLEHEPVQVGIDRLPESRPEPEGRIAAAAPMP